MKKYEEILSKIMTVCGVAMLVAALPIATYKAYLWIQYFAGR